MAILIRVNGNPGGEGFLIAPDGTRNFPVPVGLKTDDGTTVSAVLQTAGGGASLVFASTNVTIGPSEIFVNVHATSASAARNDTVLQVLVGAVVQASFNLTAIQNPEVWFRGRFQARFATDSSYYNDPDGLSTTDGLPPAANQSNIRGWNFKLIGEPDFCPPKPASIVDVVDKAGVGRVIRFNNPVALRSQVAPVGVTVEGIRALVGGTLELWTAGDPIIGLPVNLGPDTYFAGNSPKDPADPVPAEQFGAALEPLGQFQIHIGTLFSGKPATPADRPIAGGLPPLSASEIAQYGIVTLSSFQSTRKTALINEYNALSAADQAGTPGQNLKTRIAHLGGDSGLGVAAHPKAGTAGLGWSVKELYQGLVNSGIHFSPNSSTVLSYMAGYGAFVFEGKFLNYHADEQCGQVHGKVATDPSSGIPPLQTGVYNIQSREASPFTALNAQQMTDAAIDGVLAAGSVAEKVVVSVSTSLNRLVVSKAVVTNPVDPPASWTLTSRGESLVGRLLPGGSVFPRDLLFEILPPGHQENVLGQCEGIPFAPAPALGFARLFFDSGAAVWKLLLHAGTNAADGVTYKGTWSGAAVTNPTGCVPPDVEVLTPSIHFGNVEEGMTMYREIVLLNRSGGAVTVSLPMASLVAPFGAPGASSVAIASGSTGTLLVSFTAGTPGAPVSLNLSLTSVPLAGNSLDVSLTGTPVAISTVDVVLVLDRSGSMNDPALIGLRYVSKAELRNQAAQMLVDLLRDGDRIGLVRFNEDAQPHMALGVAGPVGGTGKADAALALADSNLDPSGATSVGDGMIAANTMLSAPSMAARKAMLVLTDGVENRSQFISSVALSAGIRAYAVGFGLPQNVNVDKLSAVTGNTGGYLLITGEIDEQNEYRLHKYFAQILAGISADSIVIDPRYEIGPGETQRTPFDITEADSRFDAVLMTRFPILRFSLEAPDGTRIDETNVASFNGQFVQGRECRYYRMNLPAFAGQFARNLGKWHLVVTYPGRRQLSTAARSQGTDLVRARNEKDRSPAGFDTRRGYNVLVRARSTIRMESRVEHRGFGPLEERKLVAYMTGFGLPMHKGVQLVAQLSRPDGVNTYLPLDHAGNGRFEADLKDLKQYGTYEITVRAIGHTPGNWPVRREQTLSGIVIDPTAKPEDGYATEELKDLLKEQQDLLKNILKSQDEQGRELKRLLERLVEQLGGGGGSGVPGWFFGALFVLILLLILIIILVLQQ